MSKFEELIQQYCPNGCGYKSFNEISTRIKGMTGVSRKWDSEGNCKFIDYLNAYKNIKIDTSRLENATVKKMEQDILQVGDILITSASETPDECALSSVIEDDIAEGVFLDDHLFGIRITDKGSVNSSYVNYYMHSYGFRRILPKAVRGVTRYYVSLPEFMELEIPIPPLPVQEEIVRILDKFTELEAELEAELDMRKKQYEYYRDKMLSLEDSEIKYLPDISKNLDKMRKPITSGKRVAGDTPYYGASGIVDYVNGYIFDGTYLCVSEDGANLAARVTPIAFTISGKTWVNNHAHILEFDNDNVRKYVEYYLNSISLSKYITGAAQPKLNQENLNKIPIPMPTQDNIDKIVEILDKFSTLTEDISEGLPAEIKMRHQQYEYYRDKLLNFKRLEVA